MLHAAQALGHPSSEASNRAELPAPGTVVGRRTFLRESRLNAKGERVVAVRCVCGREDRVDFRTWRVHARLGTNTSFGCISKRCLNQWLAARARAQEAAE